MKHAFLFRFIGIAAALCAAAALSFGQTRATQYQSDSIHPHSITVGYPESECTVLGSTYTTQGGGVTLTFSVGASSPFQVIRQGQYEDCSITADFPADTRALAVNTITKGARPPLTIRFSQPVTEVEFQAQIFGFGTERFTFEVFNEEDSLGVFVVEDKMDYTQTGRRGYIGARATGDDGITKIRIWAEFPDDPKHNEAVSNKFAVGPISFRLDRDQ